VRYPAVDWVCAPRDVRDHVWMVYRFHPFEVAGVEGIVTPLHERERGGSLDAMEEFLDVSRKVGASPDHLRSLAGLIDRERQ
jgi:hypothetical protein